MERFTIKCNKCGKESQVTMVDGTIQFSDKVNFCSCGYDGEIGIFCDCGNELEEE